MTDGATCHVSRVTIGSSPAAETRYDWTTAKQPPLSGAIMISNIFSGPILKMRDNCRLGGAEGRTFSGGEAVTLVTAGDH